MIKAHGGSKVITGRMGTLNTGGLVRDTMVGVQRPVHMKSLDSLISKTTGTPQDRPVMDGVLTKTTPMRKEVPELHRIPKDEQGKTDNRMAVGGTYAGPKSGYGKGGRKH